MGSKIQTTVKANKFSPAMKLFVLWVISMEAISLCLNLKHDGFLFNIRFLIKLEITSQTL